MSIPWRIGARWPDPWRSVAALALAHGIEAGFDDYLTKPIDIVEVQEAIGKALAATAAKAS